MRALLLLVSLLSLGGIAFTLAPQTNEVPRVLPADLVAAWKKGGADVGWMVQDKESTSFLMFRDGGETGRAGELPGFAFTNWQSGVLGRLPPPTDAFGLFLCQTGFTDGGMKELANLKSLRALDLSQTKVTDVGLKEISGLKALHALGLEETGVTDAGLKALTDMKSLQILTLWRTKVTDVGVKELVALKSLQWLNLGRTSVTDAGLTQLAELRSLKVLNLVETQVTNEGVARLKKALPELSVAH
jgi:hypothetical protein